MNDQLTKALIIIAIFTLVFGVFAKDYAGGGEYKFNFQKAQGNCTNENNGEACEVYTPLFHWLAGPFAFSEQSFFWFVMLLFGVIAPLILFQLTKHWTTVWFYFATTSFFWYHLDGVFPQGLAILIMVLILVVKDWRLQIGLVFLATLAHSHGFHLAMIAFICNQVWRLYEPRIQKINFKKRFAKIMLGCSGVFGRFTPDIFNTRVEISGIGLGGEAYQVHWKQIASLFTKHFPFFFWIPSVYAFLKQKKRWDLLAVVLVAVVVGVLPGNGSHRAFYVVPLLLIPGLTFFYQKTNPGYKKLILVGSVFVFAFQFFTWINSRLCFY